MENKDDSKNKPNSQDKASINPVPLEKKQF